MKLRILNGLHSYMLTSASSEVACLFIVVLACELILKCYIVDSSEI